MSLKVTKTVVEYWHAGAAGFHIEDQVHSITTVDAFSDALVVLSKGFSEAMRTS